MKKISMLFLIIIILSCAPLPNVQPKEKSNLTIGMVKKHIMKGVTDQAEILEIFGAPNLITINKKNEEVWNYNKMSFVSSGGIAGDVLFGSRVINTSTTSSFDLIIIFDEENIVKNFNVISSSY